MSNSNYQYMNLSDTIFKCMQKITLLDSQISSLQNMVNQIDYKNINKRLDELEDQVSDISYVIEYSLYQEL